jgi:hypothetical protein
MKPFETVSLLSNQFNKKAHPQGCVFYWYGFDRQGGARGRVSENSPACGLPSFRLCGIVSSVMNLIAEG